MPSVFSRIITGELPGRFIWRDERCVAFLSIAPLKPGHALVVPREEVDDWLDLETGLARHLMAVSQSIGKALDKAYSPTRVCMLIAGLEVPHAHLHVVPIDDVHDLNFDRADKNARATDLDAAAERVRTALRELGYPEVSD